MRLSTLDSRPAALLVEFCHLRRRSRMLRWGSAKLLSFFSFHRLHDTVFKGTNSSKMTARVTDGVVAQLGERRVRNAKVGSSTLLGSTILQP